MASLVNVNLPICSLKSDRVNLVEPASLAYRAMPTLLIPANVVGVPGGAVQTRTFSSGSNVHELNVILKFTLLFFVAQAILALQSISF